LFPENFFGMDDPREINGRLEALTENDYRK
jgi:hypothetical protein